MVNSDEVALGYAHAGDVRIAYKVSGTGPPLICCHAMGWDQSIWDDHRERLSVHHTLITFDQRGSGDSDHPVLAEGHSNAYSPELFAEDLRAVLDHLEIESAHILGFSMGAVAALNFAIKWPHRVRRLVLASAMASRLPQEIIDRARYIEQVVKEEGLEKAYSVYFAGAMFEGEDRTDKFKHQIQQIISKATVDGFLGCFSVTIDRPSIVDQLFKISAPTLILVGERDVHYVRESEILSSVIPDSQSRVIEDAGHALTVQQTQTFETALLDFLAAPS